MPEEDIQRLRSTRTIQTRFTIKAPIDGVITAFDLRTGMNISKDKVVAQIQEWTRSDQRCSARIYRLFAERYVAV